MRSVIAEAVRDHLAAPVRMTLGELEDYECLTAILAKFGFLYKGDMDRFEVMARRHERLRALIPYAVSPDAMDQTFARMNIALLRAAIEFVGEDEHLEAQRND